MPVTIERRIVVVSWKAPLLAVVLFVVGCTPPGALTQHDLNSRKLRVVTTTSMITELVRRVGGERTDVKGLMGPGVDPHLYKATAGDMTRLAEADLIVYNGLHLEGKMSDVFQQMNGRTRTYAITSSLEPAKELRPAPQGFEGAHDPHVWFDVRLWKKAALALGEELATLDPGSQTNYRENARQYAEELDAVHLYVAEQARQVPEDRRVLITAHDAFYYFGHAYGFEVHGLQGVSTDTETSPADIQKLASFIVERKVPAVFVESSVPPKTIQAVQAAVKARGHVVRLGGELYSDALGDLGTPAGTYGGMVRHNIDTIVKALRE